MEKNRRLSPEDQAEFDRLQAEQEKLLNKPVIRGYVRVSSVGQAKNGNSLEDQKRELEKAGVQRLYTDVCTGKTTDRPDFNKLKADLKAGDTLIVTKLDRIARTTAEGIDLICGWVEKGIKVKVLNMGNFQFETEGVGKICLTLLLAIAEFERDMIMERTRAGKEIARQKPGYHEGRPKKYTEAQIDHAVALLDEYSYTQVTEMTGISRATLIRAKAYAKKISEMK